MARRRARLGVSLSAALLSCCGDASPEGSGSTSGSSSGEPTTADLSTSEVQTTGDAPTTTAGPGTSSTTGGPPQVLAEVGHTRELRGVWVASVFNINFPSATGLTAEAQQAELVALLDVIRGAGLNAVFFQVRPESDALYASTLEPWSRFLTGTQGGDPGYDPLASLLTEAHARGLEVHAWLNPYRASASQGVDFAPGHVAAEYPEYAYEYDKFVWMDPGAEPVQQRLLAVIADLVTRYELDGIHFDDYFYPYPTDAEFPDDATWQAYLDGGGDLSRADWRRRHVDTMVKAVGETIAGLRPEVRWGISPFGIYRPGIPPGITGLDQYEALYADPLKWMQEGWLDYLAPQLYWPTTQEAQAYGALIEWWSSVTEGGRHIFAGNYLSKLGTEAKWSVDEFRAELDLSREFADAGSRGNIFFHVEPFQSNTEGIADVIRAEYYQAPALTPPIAALAGEVVAPPEVTLMGGTAALAHEAPASLRAWVVYAQAGEGWTIDRIVPASEPSVSLAPGTWAISAAGKQGVESLGVVVTAP